MDSSRWSENVRSPRIRRSPGLRCFAAVASLVAVASLATCAHAEAPQVAPEQVVHHEAGGDYDIWVVEEDGVRYLRFARDGVNQTAVKLGDPTFLEFAYTRALVAAFALTPTAKRVLIVGLGGGTLPMWLRHYDHAAHIDVVDIDPRVVATASRFLGFQPDDGLVVHVADGRRFIETAPDRWDLIILDAYGPDSIPLALATREFLGAVRDHLAPGGLVAGNLWSERANKLYPSMLRTWEAVFGEVRVVRGTASASRITLAGPAARDLTQAGLLEAADKATTRWHLAFDLAQIVREGFEGPREVMSGGSVLTDATR